jgi:hypothetical protein
MNGRTSTVFGSVLAVAVCAALAIAGLPAPAYAADAAAGQPKNLFLNPSFEAGQDDWNCGIDKGTDATFKVDSADAGDGKNSAIVEIKTVKGWGVQFGQTLTGGAKGKTYTLAAMVRSVGGPAVVGLEIERSADPWDRAVQKGKIDVPADKWTELHVTFTVEKDFSEGWFAYVSCRQPNTTLRLDLMRLYEGQYVPVEPLAGAPAGPAKPAATATPAAALGGTPAVAGKNLFTNPSFELGQSGWRMDKDKGTEGTFTVDASDAAAGKYSALLEIKAVTGWGVQFGQSFPGGAKGKTFTFAAMAKAVGSPATISLEIERSGGNYDRAARLPKVQLATDKWQELHATFTVDKDFSEGWFAYVSCQQANSSFRLDMIRLYEGEYKPHQEQAAAEAATAGVKLFDTGAPSAGPLAGEALAKHTGWAEIPADKTPDAFKGDAVLMSDKAAAVIRQKAKGVELYSPAEGGWKMRATLVPQGDGAGGTGAELSSLKVTENAPGGAALEATFGAAGAKALGLACALRMGPPMLASEPRGGTTALRVEAPSRFVALPDFFADDIVLDAAGLTAAATELPAENFVMQFLPGSDAIVVTVRKQADAGDVGVSLTGEGEARTVNSAVVPFGKGGQIWSAVLSAPAIWHVRDVLPAERDKICRLDWKQPFPAAWRMDWHKDNGLTDSWDVMVEVAGGNFMKYSLSGISEQVGHDRKRWATVLGSFVYPCWVDAAGQGYIQPLKQALKFQGPALVYPMARTAETPGDTFTVVDIVREALGVGPCEYILDLEGQRSQNHGIATCANRSTLNPIYEKGQQKQQREKIEKALKDVVIFIRFIRSRIEGYVDFGHQVQAYLADQKKAHPDLAKPLDELTEAAGEMDAAFARRKAAIKTPADAEKLADEFRATMLDYEGPDALKKCKVFTEAWVAIGGNQDELVGECRLAVKMLRQRAVLAAAAEPKLAEVAKEIRLRSQKVLRSPAGHEGARH